MPFFSIIIPTYNRAKIISPTIQSILDQTFTDWELIIVDDGGDDNTEKIISGFNDSRIKYFWKENGERGAARNFGVSKSKGQHINFFDSDDLMYDFHLTLAHNKLVSNSKINVLTFTWDYFNTTTQEVYKSPVSNKDINKNIFKKVCINLNGTFIKRKCLDKVRFAEDRNFRIAEDWYFFIKLSLKTQIFSIDISTSKYILHDNNTMSHLSSHDYLIALSYFKKLITENDIVNKHKKYLLAELYSMLSLANSIERNKIKAINFLFKSVSFNFKLMFSKRTLATIKRILC